jgi:hypothetical protein
VTLTPGQEESFAKWVAALERVTMLQRTPCRTADESRERWARLKDAEAVFASAQAQLVRSVVDGLPDSAETKGGG